MKHNECELNIPYPPIEVEEKNFRYAQLLLKDYAGPNGELTALTQYFYQYLITQNQYSDFADQMECISIVEMKHMEILGKLIVLLGGNPFYGTYDCGKYTFWSGYNISTTENIRNFLMENIEGEKLAIQAYLKHISEIKDCKIREILKRIIKDEENHIRIFNSYLKYFE